MLRRELEGSGLILEEAASETKDRDRWRTNDGLHAATTPRGVKSTKSQTK